METMIRKQNKEVDNLNKNYSNNQNANESSSRDINCYDELEISLSEFNWALDLVQTRNCRVPKLDATSDLNQILDDKEEMPSQKDRSVDESIGINRRYIDEEGIGRENMMETVVNEQNIRKADSISVLAPFFDLMNHDSSVNTVFELRFLPQNNGFDKKDGPIIPFLTVRYEGHGVKKGEQVCLNYRW